MAEDTVVEQVKGILMLCYGVRSYEAETPAGTA